MKKYLLHILLSLSLFTGCKSPENAQPEALLSIKEPLSIPFTIPADNPMKAEAIELGRFLFYDKRLSADNTISCSSCHQQEKAFTDGLALSKGINGLRTSRSAMSLTNLLWVKQLMWDGRAASLEDQVHFPVENVNEMNFTLDKAATKLQGIDLYPAQFKAAFGSETITPENIAKALAQFERTLISNNTLYDKTFRNEATLSAQELRGQSLFFQHPYPDQNLRGGNCGDCHAQITIAANKFANNGLDSLPTDPGLGSVTNSAFDVGKMRVPTLRNIALTAPYMHDGRFSTLEEVLDHYNEHIRHGATLDVLITAASNEPNGKTLKLTAQEKADIIAFLHTLTDTDFVKNKKFSNPFTP